MAVKKEIVEDTAVMDSPRIKVVVERKYDEGKHKAFSSTVIIKNGRPKLEKFRIPMKTPVELPIEIIAQLKGRGIAKFVDGKQTIVKEFIVETV